MSILKNRLREIRLKMGYRWQQDFAEFLGVQRFQYCRYENNERQPSLLVAYRICKKLGMNITDIFYDDSEK